MLGASHVAPKGRRGSLSVPTSCQRRRSQPHAPFPRPAPSPCATATVRHWVLRLPLTIAVATNTATATANATATAPTTTTASTATALQSVTPTLASRLKLLAARPHRGRSCPRGVARSLPSPSHFREATNLFSEAMAARWPSSQGWTNGPGRDANRPRTTRSRRSALSRGALGGLFFLFISSCINATCRDLHPSQHPSQAAQRGTAHKTAARRATAAKLKPSPSKVSPLDVHQRTIRHLETTQETYVHAAMRADPTLLTRAAHARSTKHQLQQPSHAPPIPSQTQLLVVLLRVEGMQLLLVVQL